MTPCQKTSQGKKNKSQGLSTPVVKPPKEMQILLQTVGIFLQMDNVFLCILLILVEEISIFVIIQ